MADLVTTPGEMKGQLRALRKELDDTFDPAKAKQLRQEIKLLNEEIKRTAGSTKDAGEKSEKFRDKLLSIQSTLRSVGSVAAAAFASISGVLIKSVEKGDPATFIQFSLAARDLAGVIGQVLSPVLQTVTGLVRGLADWIINLSPETKTIIAVVTAFTLTLAFLISALVGVGLAITAVTAAMAAFNISTGGLLLIIGAILAPIAALVGYLVYLGKTQDKSSASARAMQSTMAGLKKMFDAVVDALRPFMEAMAAIANQVGPPLIAFIATVVKLFAEMFSMIGLLVPLLNLLISLFSFGMVNSVQKLVNIINVAIIGLENMIRLLKVAQAMGGIAFGTAPAPAPAAAASSEGAGGRNVSFITGEELQRRTIAAFAAKDAENTAKNQRDIMIDELMKLNRAQERRIWDEDRRRH